MVINVPDEVVLNQLMAEYPLVAYLDIDVRPIIDGDIALAQWWRAMRRMLGNSGAAEGTVVGAEPYPEPPEESPVEPLPPGLPPDARPPG